MSRLVFYCGHGFAATFVIAALANCGGGERPPPERDPAAAVETPPEGDTITISPLSAEGLVFGENTFVDCGKQAGEKVITLSNPTNDVVNFRAKLTSGQTFYKLNPESGGGIPIRGKATIQVIPSPIPQVSEVTPDLYAGTLEITTDVRREVEVPPTIIRLHQTARGAMITSTIAGDVDFGDVKVGTAGITRFSLTNSGNVDATANFELGSQAFRIDEQQTATALLNPGGVVNKVLTASPPTTGNYNDSLNITFNTTAVHCKPPPAVVKMKGRGTTSVGVSPGTLTFGNVPCGGSAAAAQEVVISSTVQMTFKANLGKGATSPYELKDKDDNPLTLNADVPMAAGATYTMRVVPRPIVRPASVVVNAFGDTLTIATDVPSDVVHTVALTETAQGAIFKFTPNKIERLTEEPNNVSTNDVAIENSGNAPAPFSLSIVPLTSLPLTPGQMALVNAGPFGGSTTTATVTIQAPGAFDTPGWGALHLTPAPGAFLCSDPPSDLPISVKTKPPT